MSSGPNGPPNPEQSKRPLTFLDGVLYGFEIGREQGFGEGVKAMRRAITKIMREGKEKPDAS